MPIFVLPFLALAVGAAGALAAVGEGRERRRYTVMRDRASRIVWLIAFLLLAPNAAYFFCRYPDWSVAYLFRAAKLPSAAALLIACGGAALAGAGFRVGLALVRDERRRALIVGIGACLGGAVLATAALGSRLWAAGTFEEFKHPEEMQTLSRSWLGLSVVLINALTLVGVWVALSAPARTARVAATKARPDPNAAASPLRAPRGPMPKLRGSDLRRG